MKMDATTNTSQHGLQSDNLGFLVGQRRIERITANIAQDTQEIVRLLKSMIQDRVINPPINQIQGLAAAIIQSQRRATTEITGAIRALPANAAATPRPTVDVGGVGQTGTASRTIPNQPTVDVRSNADLPPTPDTAPDTAPDAAPNPTPDTAPDTVPNPTPDAAPNPTPDTAPDTAPNPVPNPVPDPVPSTRTNYVRDANGRFVAQSGSSASDAIPEDTDGRVNNGRRRSANGRFEGGDDSKSWLNSFKDAVSGGVSTGMADTKGVDPMVDAVNELGGMLSPVKKAAGFAFKPISMLMKRNKRNEPLPAEQERHNRDERKFWGRLVDAVKAQGGGDGFFSRMGKQAAIAMAAVAAAAVATETVKDAGQAITDKLNETETGRSVLSAIGEGTAHVAAFFGSDEAQRAIDDNAAAKNNGVLPSPQVKTSKPVGDMTWRERWLVLKAAGGSEDARAELRDKFPDNPAGRYGDSEGAKAARAAAESQSDASKVPQQGALGDFAGLADAVGFGEGNYNSVNRGANARTGQSYGSTTANLSEMTINEVLERNTLKFGDPRRMNAVGKYQIIAKTMKGLKASMRLTGEEKLTPEMQDKLFMGLMPESVKAYVSGKSNNKNAAIIGLAKEYASIGVPVDMDGHKRPVRTGESFYQDHGGNKANPQSLPRVSAALDAMRQKTQQPAALPETSRGLAEYAEAQPIPAATQPPTPVIPTANQQSMIMPAARVMSLPLSASSARQAPNLPAMPPMPKVRELVSSPAPQVVTIAQSADTISQNVGDRAIAHAVTGGLGMRGWDG